MLKSLLMKMSSPLVNPVTRKILKKHYAKRYPADTAESDNRVFVLAPHMDDETIGPGGALYEHARSGSHITCVFLTNGAKSNAAANDITALRKAEIERVKEILQIDEVIYLDHPDGSLHQVSDKEITELANLISEKQPDIIYTTGSVDSHTDHTATAQMLSEALQKLPEDVQPIIREYEINCPVPPEFINKVIRLSDEAFTQKKLATEEFKSQVIAFDGFLELNRIKRHLSKHDETLKYAESFIQSDRIGFINKTEALKEAGHPYPELFKQANRTQTLLWAIFKNHDMKRKIYAEGSRHRQ